MSNQEIKKDPEFLTYVLELTKGKTVLEALDESLNQIHQLDIDQLKRIGLKTYEEGKWSIHKILQHLIDWERIWCFRAIIFARNEGSTPEAHDQEVMGTNSNADELTIQHLLNELTQTRKATKLMFESFNEEILNRKCVFFEYEMPLFSIGLTVAAHQIHHFNVIKEKYLPLDS